MSTNTLLVQSSRYWLYSVGREMLGLAEWPVLIIVYLKCKTNCLNGAPSKAYRLNHLLSLYRWRLMRYRGGGESPVANSHFVLRVDHFTPLNYLLCLHPHFNRDGSFLLLPSLLQKKNKKIKNPLCGKKRLFLCPADFITQWFLQCTNVVGVTYTWKSSYITRTYSY